MTKLWDMLRAALVIGLLMGAAASPAAAIADARHHEPAAAEVTSRRTDWPLLAVALVALVIGRTVVHRRRKSGETPRN